MGKVAITFRIMPESADASIEGIKGRVEELGAKQVVIEDVAFGLKALKALFIMEDSQGEHVESKLREIKGVGSVDTEGITLV